jgi:hypothetical protein
MGAILLFADGVQAQTIFNSLKWYNRVLVMHAPEEALLDLQTQVALFQGVVPELEERDLLVLNLRSQVLEKVPDLSPFPFDAKILENRQERRYLEGLFVSDIDALKITLIGLDGEIKESWSGVIEPAVIFEAIDTMPMRQRELEATDQ